MKKLATALLVGGIALGGIAGMAPQAEAGCLTGAAVGGTVGHFAGHHAVLGAAAGCAIGHHRATVARRQERSSGDQATYGRDAYRDN